MADMAGDRVDNGLRAHHSTDRFAANRLNSLATADNTDIANTADIEDPRMDHSRVHTFAPEDRGRSKEAN